MKTLVTIAALFAATAGHAQDHVNYIGAQIDADRYGDLMKSNLRMSSSSTPSRSVGRSATPFYATPATSRAAAVPFTYTPTAALRRQARGEYVSRIAHTNREAAYVMRDQFAKHDYSTIYSGLIRGAGLRENDAADAVAAYSYWAGRSPTAGPPRSRTIRSAPSAIRSRHASWRTRRGLPLVTAPSSARR